MYVANNAIDGYRQALYAALDGTLRPSRAGDTIEAEDFSIQFADPTQMIQARRPGFSPLLGLMEGLQLIGSAARPALMDAYWPKMKAYTDHWGDYGDRLITGNQLSVVFNELKTNPNTRRAILTLWEPQRDVRGEHMDHPCTLSIGFRVRDGKLNMSVTMRSNDVWKGMSSDLIQFAFLQVTLARALRLDPGTYTHYAYSLHLYQDDVQAAREFLVAPTEANRISTISPISHGGWGYEQIRTEAQNVMSHTAHPETLFGRIIESEMLTRARQLEEKTTNDHI